MWGLLFSLWYSSSSKVSLLSTYYFTPFLDEIIQNLIIHDGLPNMKFPENIIIFVTMAKSLRTIAVTETMTVNSIMYVMP
jgi:hypothetical protein